MGARGVSTRKRQLHNHGRLCHKMLPAAEQAAKHGRQQICVQCGLYKASQGPGHESPDTQSAAVAAAAAEAAAAAHGHGRSLTLLRHQFDPSWPFLGQVLLQELHGDRPQAISDPSELLMLSSSPIVH